MDIILDTTFNNPRLPIVPRAGLRDSFNRAAASTLGLSDDGKQWEQFNSASAGVWGTTGSGTATLVTAGGANQLAVADALASDGTLTAKLSSISAEAGSRRAGLVIRAVDASNYISIAPVSPSNADLRVRLTLAGTPSASMPGSIPPLVAGDELAVTCVGASISVSVNGVQRFTGDIPELQTATRHGFYAYGSALIEWDWIEFVAA